MWDPIIIAAIAAAVAVVIGAFAKGAVDVIKALNRTTAAVEVGNREAAYANVVKIKQAQGMLAATPGASPVTVSDLPINGDEKVGSDSIAMLVGSTPAVERTTEQVLTDELLLRIAKALERQQQG